MSGQSLQSGRVVKWPSGQVPEERSGQVQNTKPRTSLAAGERGLGYLTNCSSGQVTQPKNSIRPPLPPGESKIRRGEGRVRASSQQDGQPSEYPSPRRCAPRTRLGFTNPKFFRRPAFTLMEMLVAVSIMTVMVLIIDRVFFNATRAVRAGVGVSDVMNQSRSVNQQLVEDAKQMIGPGVAQGGFADSNVTGVLVIVHHILGDDVTADGRLDGDEFNLSGAQDYTGRNPKSDGMLSGAELSGPGPHEGVPVWHPVYGTVRRLVRSDQLTFFIAQRDLANEKFAPLTPGSTTSFHYPTLDDEPPYARVWYGHGLRTTPNGQSVVGSLGQEVAGNPNRLANQWILGRQALVMAAPYNAAGSQIPNSGGNPITVYASTTSTLALVVGTNFPLGGPTVQNGLTDLTIRPLTYPAGQSPTNPVNALIARTSTVPGNNYALYTDQAKNLYDSRVIDNGILVFTGGSDARRLWINPRPSNDDGAMTSLAAWQVAQMHGLLASNVSDFIVDFAADINNDGLIDTLPDNGGGYYDDGTSPDLFDRNYAPIPAGSIVWYTSPRFANYRGGTNGYDSTEPLTLSADTNWASGTPYSSVNGPYHNAAGVANANGGAFVFRHDDTQAWTTGDPNSSKWPYMLRIRYRMHDKDSLLTAGQAAGTLAPGRWQEIILKVNRP